MNYKVDNKCCVIFGGAGFVGLIFAKFLLDCREFVKIYVADIVNPAEVDNQYKRDILADPRIVFLQCDVRQSIKLSLIEDVELICNFAAIHREPGHSHHEYYETNISGANNVIDYALSVNCKTILFTSSISPYGSDFREKTEDTSTCPTSPYGNSKLVAEKIHQNWQIRGSRNRLIILRPGVIFGPGEGGNVTRLIQALRAGYFIYMGNKNVKKAGIYIFELCEIMKFLLLKTQPGNLEIVNVSYTPNPTLEDYVKSILCVLRKSRKVYQAPYIAIYVFSHIITALCNVVRIKQPFSPVRVKKLIIPNKIIPERLEQLGYVYRYSLASAMIDWNKKNPSDWN